MHGRLTENGGERETEKEREREREAAVLEEAKREREGNRGTRRLLK